MADSVILDQRGQPIRRNEMTREIATASMTGVRSVWQYDSVSWNLTPQRLVSLLQNAINGEHQDYLTLAEEMEDRDLHYASVLSTRKLAVSGLPVVVEAASDDKRDVDLAGAVRELTRRPAFGEMIDDALDALGKGYSVNEIIWNRDGSQWFPERYVWRDPRFFMFDRDTGQELRLIDEADMMNGVPLAAYKFIIHKPRIKSGLPIRRGLARLAAVGYMCKSYSVKDWMAFAEVFGMPLRVGRYGPNASAKDINTLINAVANIGSDAAAVIPESMRIEFEAGSNGSGGDKLFLGLAEWWDKQISKGVLGQTMTADDGSSLSQAKVHDEVRGDIKEADAKQLANTLNRDLVKPFIDLNFGVQENYPCICLHIPEAEDIEALTTALERLVPLGLKVEASVVRDKLGLPDPAEGDDVELLQPAEQPVPPALNHAQHCPHCQTAINREQRDDAIDELLDDPVDDWEPQMDPILEPVMTLARNSDDYETFRAGLSELVGQMDNTELVEQLAKAAFKARGLGDATDSL